MTASIIRTLESVFAAVDIYPNYDVERSTGGGSITVLASRSPLKPFDRGSVAAFPVNSFAARDVDRFLGKPYRIPAGTPGIVLTDDYNPIDFYDVWLKEWVRKNILDNIEMDLLI